MKILLLIPMSLLLACGQSAPEGGVIAGRVDPLTLGWVQRAEAVSDGELATHSLDSHGNFRIQVQRAGSFRLRLTDLADERSRFVTFQDGSDTVVIGSNAREVDVGAITAMDDDDLQADGPDEVDDGDDDDEPDAGMDDDSDDDDDDDDGGDGGGDDDDDDDVDAGQCEVDVDECRFSTYNLEVQVGDRFVITNFLERCHGVVGADFVFGYEDNETWNLDAFNSDGVVEIVEEDLDGGNHGDGEYRVNLYGANEEELDHMTLRIGHNDESDIEPGDEIPPQLGGSQGGAMCPGEPDDHSGDGDGDDACEADEDCAAGKACVDNVCTGA